MGSEKENKNPLAKILEGGISEDDILKNDASFNSLDGIMKQMKTTPDPQDPYIEYKDEKTILKESLPSSINGEDSNIYDASTNTTKQMETRTAPQDLYVDPYIKIGDKEDISDRITQDLTDEQKLINNNEDFYKNINQYGEKQKSNEAAHQERIKPLTVSRSRARRKTLRRRVSRGR